MVREIIDGAFDKS